MLFEYESAIIRILLVCEEMLDNHTTQENLNDLNLANRNEFYFLFWWTPSVIDIMIEL
jgi:hypothetical protein